MAKAKNKREPKIPTMDELVEQALKEHREEDIAKYSGVVPNPTRTFVVGEPCKVGNLDNCVVKQVLDDSKFYLVEFDFRKKRDQKAPYPRVVWVRAWFDVEKLDFLQQRIRILI